MKNYYGTLAILIFTSTVAFSSCKKDKAETKDSTTNGTATAVVNYDGKFINFSSVKDSSVAFMEWVATEKKHVFSIVLKDDATGMILDMMIYPAKEGSGSYSLEGLSADMWSLANFHLKGRNSSETDKYTFVWISSNGIIVESKGTVTITSMTDKNVKGSFSATLHNYNDVTKKSKEVTIAGGSFDVPLVRRDFDLANIP